MGESSNATSNQPMTDDETPSSHSSDSEGSMNTYQRNTRGNPPKAAPKVLRKKDCCSCRNKDRHQQNMCLMLHAPETSLEETKGEHVKQMNPPHSWWSTLLSWFFKVVACYGHHYKSYIASKFKSDGLFPITSKCNNDIFSFL